MPGLDLKDSINFFFCPQIVSTLEEPVFPRIYGLIHVYECIIEKVEVAPIMEKMVESRLKWFGHVWRRSIKALAGRVDQMKSYEGEAQDRIFGAIELLLQQD